MLDLSVQAPLISIGATWRRLSVLTGDKAPWLLDRRQGAVVTEREQAILHSYWTLGNAVPLCPSAISVRIMEGLRSQAPLFEG